MKTMYSMKKWVLLSFMFIGISLTVYAVAPAVFIREITVQNVTSTTAEIEVRHIGASCLYIQIHSEDGSYFKEECILTGTTDLAATCTSTYLVSDLLPNERYYVLVIAGGFPDLVDFEETNSTTATSFFMTQLQ